MNAIKSTRKACPVRMAAAVTSVALVIMLFVACATAPVTGRRQMLLIPESDMVEMSETEYRKVLNDSTLADDTEDAEMLRRVGERISIATEDFLINRGESKLAGTFEWEFHLIKDDEMVNAWCMPGGKIAFYTGILPYTQDENGMAVVMGHEVAHAVQQHGNERASQSVILGLGLATLNEAMSSKPDQTRELILGAVGAGATVGYVMPFGRNQESEADRVGLILMAKAGYDPRGAVDFWQRMSEAGGASPPEFLSTHPSHDTRISNIQQHMPEAMMYYEQAPAP